MPDIQQGRTISWKGALDINGEVYVKLSQVKDVIHEITEDSLTAIGSLERLACDCDAINGFQCDTHKLAQEYRNLVRGIKW